MDKEGHVQDISGQSVKVSVIGASGYTGAELLRLLLYHPFVQIVSITSRQYEGKCLSEVFPHFCNSSISFLKFERYEKEKIAEISDVVFLCLPHKTAFPIVKELYETESQLKIIDFSADFRFTHPEVYEKVYDVKHSAKEIFCKAAYGLPEIFREEIRKKSIIANPGCYPTSVILGLYPAKVSSALDVNFPVIADSKSGITGAGRKALVSLNFCEVNNNFRAYAIENHRHGPEIAEKLGVSSVRFTPHLVPMNRGILSTIYFKTPFSEEKLRTVYRQFYKEEYFVRVKDKPPETCNVAGTNFCDIYVTKDEKTGIGIVVSVIDNIGKGASGQAVQNMNVVCSFPEDTGLQLFSNWI